MTTDDTRMHFDFDLDGHEMARRAAVLEAMVDGTWDPIEALEGEKLATAMLYSNLDGEQQRIYDELVRAGVL